MTPAGGTDDAATLIMRLTEEEKKSTTSGFPRFLGALQDFTGASARDSRPPPPEIPTEPSEPAQPHRPPPPGPFAPRRRRRNGALGTFWRQRDAGSTIGLGDAVRRRRRLIAATAVSIAAVGGLIALSGGADPDPSDQAATPGGADIPLEAEPEAGGTK